MTIQYQNDTELQLKGFITLYNLRRKRTNRRFLLVLMLLILYCGFLYLTGPDHFLGYFATFTLVWCLFQFSAYFNTINTYKKLFRQRELAAEVSYNIEKECLVYKDNGKEIRQNWNALKGTLRYKEFLYILPKNSLSLMYWIHKDNIGEEKFLEFTREIREYLPTLSAKEV